MTELFDRVRHRLFAGHWATGVSLVTCPGADGPLGCTLNAFTSLSLEPPLHLLCFDRGSRTLEAVRRSRLFCMNILAADQESIARRFATKLEMSEKFAGIEYRIEHGVPVIEGVVASIVCTLEQELEGGDHAIVLGRPITGAIDAQAEPLMFFRGDYRLLR